VFLLYRYGFVLLKFCGDIEGKYEGRGLVQESPYGSVLLTAVMKGLQAKGVLDGLVISLLLGNIGTSPSHPDRPHHRCAL
jgi:hypothetical protein